MKRFLRHLVINLLTLLMLASCVTEMKIDEISLKEEVVVNSICVAGEPISVTLLLTIPRIYEAPMFNDSIHYNELQNATVKLWVDGVKTEQLTYIPADNFDRFNLDYTDSSSLVCLGYYKAQTICQTGRTYKIEVTHPDYETVTCQTTVPNEISTVSIGNVDIQSISRNGSGLSPFKITFTDTPNEKNFYRILIAYERGEHIWNHSEDIADTTKRILVRSNNYGSYNLEDPLLFPDNENANDLIFGTVYNRFQLFTDDFIDGETHVLDFTASCYAAFDREMVEGEFFQITVTLQVINQDEYLYLKSLTLFKHFENEFMAEPVQVYSNIENGVGIFSGAINYSRTFQVGEYPVDGFNYYYSKFGGIQYSNIYRGGN
jgi:hypothetical protein